MPETGPFDVYDVYCEFPTPRQASVVLEGLPWERPTLVVGCNTDPNPAVIKLTVRSLNPVQIKMLAESLGATRITRENVELYPNP